MNRYCERLWSILVVFCAALATLGGSAHAQDLYGIISLGQNGGSLVRINSSTGAATLVGPTGMGTSAGLTYDSTAGALLGMELPSGGQVWLIDPATGVGTALASPVSSNGPQCVAYRSADNSLYTVSTFFGVNLTRLNPTTGANLGVVGPVGQDAVGGLASRPSDSQLFGSGFILVTDSLFTLSTTVSSADRDTSIGTLDRSISGMDFHPNGTLYASDGDNLVTINTSTAAVSVIGAHGSLGFVAGIAFVPTATPGNPDVWIKDCASDTGTVPSYPTPCPHYWKSPDIWIDNNGDMIIDAPVVGVDNTLHAAVRNLGGAATNVAVSFYYRDNTTGLVFPNGATLIGTDTVNVGANGGAVASVVWPNLPAPPQSGGHWCIGVVLNHTQDPAITPAVPAYDDNNVGIANIWFIAGRAGEQVVLDFNAGSGGSGGFGLRDWPRDFVLEVEAKLPAGWTWTLEGLEADKPFTLKLGEQRPTQLRIHVAENARPRAGGFVDVRQVDIKTKRIVGGVHFDLYEDHHAPRVIDRVLASVVDGRPVLTWDPVLRELETNMRERVAYYEVLRNGTVAAKMIRDRDPRSTGIQWVDEKPPQGAVKYAIRAVDEAGNRGEASPAVTVKLPTKGGLFNWLTWALLILAGVLLLLVFARR